MSAHASVAALRVANEAFLVSSTIERCPKTMMLRELVVNAIEAASQAQGPKHVDIMSIRIDGVPKLCIRNAGRGMSAVELDRICDLASSLYKENSLDANFGMGAKVASLPSNKHGLRYRSCKDGSVSEVILCQRDGVYGRLRRGEDANAAPIEVVDATAACQAEGGYNLDADWTEVVLFGNGANQNTVTDPYGGNPRMEPDWLTKNLLLRFYRIPPDVVVRLSPDVLGGGHPRVMQTLGEAAAPTASAHNEPAQTETVRTPSGIAIHYRYYPPAADAAHPASGPIPRPHAPGAPAHPYAIGCIVYKDEIYDPRTDARWALDAPTYGIPFGAKFCAVFVELPDDYLVRPEAYRQFLRFRGGDQRQVFLHDFGQLVTSYLPAWLKAVIRAHGPQQEKFVNEIEDELCDLLEELGVDPAFKPPPPPVKPAEAQKADPAPPAPPPATPPEAEAPQAPKDKQAARAPQPSPPPPRKFERPPEIIGLDSDELIDERGLKGRAAKFYQTSHQLFVNLKYPAVQAVAVQLEAEFDAALNAERMRSIAQNVAGWAITRRIARALVYSLSKKAAGWPADDVARAQSPESFSLVADDWATVVEPARKRMEEELGTDWQPVADVSPNDGSASLAQAA
jgi:hypothetical protein